MNLSHIPAPFAEDSPPAPKEHRGDDRWILLRPHDTVQVRDGRTFDGGTGGIAETVHPWPSTVAGALASKDGGLGGEPESVRGPILARRMEGHTEEWLPYFQVPLDLYHPRTDDTDVRRMSPGEREEEVFTDLDEVTPGLRMFTAHVKDQGSGTDGEKAPEPIDRWMSGEALQNYLHGELVDFGAEVPEDELDLADEKPLEPELRVGLAIDPETRTAKHGALYQATHLRLHERWAFAAHVTPHPGRHRPLEEVTGPVRFGGMARMADIDPAPGLEWPERPASFPDGRLLLYVATPGVWPKGWRPPIENSGAELVAALVDAPLAVATASPDRDARKFRSTRFLYYAVPPGAVYLMKFPNTDDAERWAERYHGRALPLPEPIHRPADVRLATAGFGVVLTGVWS
ncbi:type III-B CRISPR module-associated Cmr3 family protein [Nocardiopsis alba]|jgi:CRISPR type III-B/RAMP module-associated protein Cmr3|uniref:type III-B CRISPR module-associated Cmr3 family protein n=1 Tax=Nocardiopsis alba TaxID=53437 RepID=UPI0033BD3CD4